MNIKPRVINTPRQAGIIPAIAQHIVDNRRMPRSAGKAETTLFLLLSQSALYLQEGMLAHILRSQTAPRMKLSANGFGVRTPPYGGVLLCF